MIIFNAEMTFDLMADACSGFMQRKGKWSELREQVVLFISSCGAKSFLGSTSFNLEFTRKCTRQQLLNFSRVAEPRATIQANLVTISLLAHLLALL